MRDPAEIRARLQGPCNSVPTIFTPEGEIDHVGIRAVLDHSLDAGCDVIMLT
ncbi:MAG: hypothetical protein HY332_17155 [Chloroflexi bacterium]|nr:hypothetical protein [Chloroflexota bacterium]